MSRQYVGEVAQFKDRQDRIPKQAAVLSGCGILRHGVRGPVAVHQNLLYFLQFGRPAQSSILNLNLSYCYIVYDSMEDLVDASQRPFKAPRSHVLPLVILWAMF